MAQNERTHFRRRWLIAVRLAVHVDHLYAILVTGGHSDGIPEVSWGCSSRFLLHPLRTCGDLNLIDSDLTGGRKLNRAWVASKAKAACSEIKVRRGGAIQTKLVLQAGQCIIR
jgi:hypothetical protein